MTAGADLHNVSTSGQLERPPRHRTTKEPATDAPTPSTFELHQAVILDHFRNPRNHGPSEPPALEGAAYNQACGDTVKVWVRIEDDRIAAISFDGRGCTISQAAASMVTELVEGSTVEEVARLRKDFGGTLAEDGDEVPAGLGDLRALAGVRRFPNRVRCAMLALEALEDAIANGTASPPKA